MVRFISIVLVVGFGVGGCGGANESSHPQSKIEPGQAIDASRPGGAVIEVMEKEIDLGVIPAETGEIVGAVYFRNIGNQPLQVSKVTGPCNCFAGYSGDTLLQPTEGGELLVKFDKSKIPSGRIRRLARIMTNDTQNKAEEVYFNFTVERTSVEEEIRTLRQELSNLRAELRSVNSELKKVIAKLDGAENGQAQIAQKQANTTSTVRADTTVYAIEVGSSPVLGPEDAPVTIVEFVDFQCPYCSREYPKIKQVLEEYPGKVRVVFKHYTLSFHKKARPAHAAAQLALLEGGQDAFWKMHDMLMSKPGDLQRLDVEALRGYAKELGLDLEKFSKAINDDEAIGRLLETDMTTAKRCNVRGTPAVFINGLKLTDRSIEGYRKHIDETLNSTKTVSSNL